MRICFSQTNTLFLMFYKNNFRKLHVFGCFYIEQICCITCGLDATIQSTRLVKLLVILLNSVVSSFERKKGRLSLPGYGQQVWRPGSPQGLLHRAASQPDSAQLVLFFLSRGRALHLPVLNSITFPLVHSPAWGPLMTALPRTLLAAS